MEETKDTIYGSDTNEKQVEKSEDSTSNSEVKYDWGKHPNSQKAVKKHQFKKGQVANPLGRKPQFEKLKQNLIDLADEEITNYRDEVLGTYKELVLHRIWRDAKDGDMKKIQLLAWLGCLD